MHFGKSAVRTAVLILSVLLAGLAGFYLFYWVRTPMYAAGEIQQAVQHREYQLFRERVDLRKVYGYALDDLAAEAGASASRDHKLAARLIPLLKKPLTEELIRQTELAFRRGTESGEDASPLSDLTRTAKAYVGSTALSLTDILDVTETDGKAVVSLRLRDKALQQDFTWQLQMEKDVNGR